MRSHRPRGLDQTFFQVWVAVHISLKMWPLPDCSVNSFASGRLGSPCERSLRGTQGNIKGFAQLFLCFSLSYHLLLWTVLRAHTLVGFGCRFQSSVLPLLVWYREEADDLECPPASGQQSSWKAVLDDVFSCVFVDLLSGQSSPCRHSYMFGFLFSMHLLYNWNK